MPYRVSPRVAHQVVGGEAVLVDLAGARMMGLNATGSLVWSLLPDHDEEGIARALSERYDVELPEARKEVRDFLAGLLARGLVVTA
jgi:hypothetical protein